MYTYRLTLSVSCHGSLSLSLSIVFDTHRLTHSLSFITQMFFSSYTKLRILHYVSKPYTITKLLEKNDGIKVSRFSVAKFIKVYATTGTISWWPGSGRLSKELVEAKMVDDETTTTPASSYVHGEWHRYLKTILRCRTALGWTFHGSSYCQLIREVNS